MAKQRGLGRGLGALLGGDEIVAEVVSGSASTEGLKSLAVDTVHRGKHQPRVKFDTEALQELADSIAKQGVVQPIVVRESDQGFEIVAGERRWRAAQIAGLHEIPAVVRELDERSAAAISLVENIQREDLTALEEANALSRLQEHFDLTHQQIAELIGRSRAAVSNLLRLLELHPDVKKMLDHGELEMGHARALLALKGNDQITAAKAITAKGMTVRAAETLVNQQLTDQRSTPRAEEDKPRRDPDIASLEHRLAETLGAPVAITHKRTGGGKLELKYSNLDELEGILEHIK